MKTNRFVTKQTIKVSFSVALVCLIKPSFGMVINTDSGSYGSDCQTKYSGDIRPMDETSSAFKYQWVKGLKNFSKTQKVVSDAQEMKYCLDGTIRDKNDQCLTRVDSQDNYNIMAECEADNLNQQFEELQHSDCLDNIKNSENCLILKNTGSQQCLSSTGASNDQGCTEQVMFRSKGDRAHYGSIQNVGTSLCLHPVEIDDQVKVTSTVCDDEDQDFNFTAYYNGEIIHEVTGLCLGNMKDQTNGLMVLDYCSDIAEQSWREQEIEGSFYVHSNFDDLSLTSNIEGSDMTKETLIESDFQKWRFTEGNGEWAYPTFEWIKVGCDTSIDMTTEFMPNTFDLDKDGNQVPISEEDMESLQLALLNNQYVENAIEVAQSDVSAFYETISDMIYHPWDDYINAVHSFKCQSYELQDFQEGDGGCLYRSLMTVHNWYRNEDVFWNAPLTRCTAGQLPVCPPLTECNDSNCTSCVLNFYTDE